MATRGGPGDPGVAAFEWPEKPAHLRALTDEEWDVSVTHMRVRGNLPASDVRDILAFLQASNNQ